MASQNGIRLYFKTAGTLAQPSFILLPKKEGLLYSMTFATGVIWRQQQAMSCFEIRAFGLSVKKDDDTIILFLKHSDSECVLYAFPEAAVVGITDLENQDIVPDTLQSDRCAE
jgi:hypothetical protein